MGLPDKNNAVKLASTYVCQVVELDSAALAREEREKTIGCHNQRVNKGCTRAVNKRSHCCSRDRRTSQNVKMAVEKLRSGSRGPFSQNWH